MTLAYIIIGIVVGIIVGRYWVYPAYSGGARRRRGLSAANAEAVRRKEEGIYPTRMGGEARIMGLFVYPARMGGVGVSDAIHPASAL